MPLPRVKPPCVFRLPSLRSAQTAPAPRTRKELTLARPEPQMVAAGAPDDKLRRKDHPARLFHLVLRLDPGQEHLGAHVPKVIARLPHRREGYIGEPQKLDVV